MIKPLPCPFCGGEEIEADAVGAAQCEFVAYCIKCQASGPAPPAMMAWDAEEAIGMWNERKPNG